MYLVGTRGRRSFALTLAEDFVALVIMVVRVLLQAIRGVIVGMFHFICREALLNMTRWTAVDAGGAGAPAAEAPAPALDYALLAADVGLAAGSLVLVTAIMFLQLIFLMVSVWLFCKCWFIS